LCLRSWRVDRNRKKNRGTSPPRFRSRTIVYDVLGRGVAVLARGPHEAGYHSATWNATSASSGVYFAMLLVTDDLGAIKYKQVNKLLLVK
jgi:hypothetical protein